jgi:inner membrane protein
VENLSHTLTGWALGEAGLKQRTRFANATLMIAANLPDVDVLVYATSTSPIAFRRGWTHGLLAQVLLPIALTAVMAIVARLKRRPVADREHTDPVAFSWAWTLLLASIGVESHVFMDFLNNYGVRLLAPFDWRWFYGDALFIADPWLWLTLGGGIWLAKRRRAPQPARVGVLVAACYMAVMLTSAQAAREVVATTWTHARGAAPKALMVGPRPLTPLTRDVIVDAGDHYETGTFSWLDRTVSFDATGTPKNAGNPAVKRAMAAPPIEAFLTWARFPFWVTLGERRGQQVLGTRVIVGDMRFAGFGPLRVVGDRARFTASTLVGAAAAATTK